MIKSTGKSILISFLAAFLLIGCSSDDSEINDSSSGNNLILSEENSIKNFTWKAMNSWYNWQTSVEDLKDSKDDDLNEYYSYLEGYNTAEDLFESLIYEPGVTDRFSWFIEDYVAQQQQFQGIYTSFGINPMLLRLGETDYVIMVIEHISKGSPADIAGFKRGDIINGLDGTIMTINNYSSVLDVYYNNETVEFNFVESDGITAKENKTITKTVVSDDPVYLTKTFDNIGGNKVGYLVYNGFRSSYNDELNTAFAELASSNIQELILDFRLNGGGSVETCAYLASMIYASANSNEIFATLNFNSKHSEYDDSYTFEDTMRIYDTDGSNIGTQTINRITGLSRVYILTSGGTASASEMIINGLKPFIDVITVGETTYGNNVGSITLYDNPTSDYLNSSSTNTSHTNAMQPIVFQIYNKNYESDYTQGFEPDIFVDESFYWNEILPFGDENEVVLKAALNDIRGVSAKISHKSNNSQKIDYDFSSNKFDKEMYITKDFFESK